MRMEIAGEFGPSLALHDRDASISENGANDYQIVALQLCRPFRAKARLYLTRLIHDGVLFGLADVA